MASLLSGVGYAVGILLVVAAFGWTVVSYLATFAAGEPGTDQSSVGFAVWLVAQLPSAFAFGVGYLLMCVGCLMSAVHRFESADIERRARQLAATASAEPEDAAC